jgi:DNA-binding MarR family transcriptional regulator
VHVNNLQAIVSLVDLAPDYLPIGRQLGRSHKVVRAWGDRCLAPLDATVTDWILLFFIEDAAAPGLSQTDVARFADMTGPALVRHLDRLEAEGILQRIRDPDDRRVMRVRLTERGRARRDQIGAVMTECDRELRAVLTTEEQDVLERATTKLFEFAQARLNDESEEENRS